MKMKLSYIAIFSFAILFTSCDKWIDSDINIDPNNPLDVEINQMVTSAQAAYAYLNGGDLGRYNSVFTQHHAGVERQHAGIDTYGFTESDVNNSYETLYASIMQDLDVMIDKASDPEKFSGHYRGIARTMMAMALMQVTDLYDAMPYSDAFQGTDGNLSASYDSQESIYGSVQSLLSGAIADFGGAPGAIIPGSEDVIYGGDIAAWTAMARTLSARAYVHIGNRGAGNYASALGQIDAGAISDNSGDAQVAFDPGNESPWFQFMDQRGDIRMGQFFIDLMVAEGDPRLPVIATEGDNGGYYGSPAGSPDLTASTLLHFNNQSAPIPLVTYAEAKFLEAEAAFQDGDPDRAATAHNEAVLASLAKYGVSDAAFEAAHANQDGASITLEEIMTQKYVALYAHPETFSDWRRTGIPDLQPAANAQGNGQIPTRWPYPQNERLYNENFPGAATINEKVWWDN